MAKKKTTDDTTTPSSPAPTRRRAPARKQTATATAPVAAANEGKTAAPPHAGNGKPEPTRAEIAEAAYFRHLRRGVAGGDEFTDWVEAERELRQRR